MKSLLALATTPLLAWATATAALAAPVPLANVNFSSAQGLPFSLVLDGRTMTNPVARQVHIDQLAPGRHWADFSLTTPYGQPMRFHTTVWLEPGLETSYLVAMGPYGPQLQRVGAVAVGGPAYGQGDYQGDYPPQMPQPVPNTGNPGNYPVPNAPNPGDYPAPNAPNPGDYPAPNTGNSTGNPGAYPAPNTGNPGAYPAPNNAPYGNSPADAAPAQAPAPGTYQPGSAPDGSYDPNATPPADADGSNSFPPLPSEEVQDLAQELRGYPSDNARLTTAKQALAQSSVSAEELAQLLGTLNLDKSRIALAEFGYAHVSDPQNFSVVYAVFHLPSSVREVQQALGLPQE